MQHGFVNHTADIRRLDNIHHAPQLGLGHPLGVDLRSHKGTQHACTPTRRPARCQGQHFVLHGDNRAGLTLGHELKQVLHRDYVLLGLHRSFVTQTPPVI